jgi:Alpha-L-arabinofuranosidase B (ABFB) domain
MMSSKLARPLSVLFVVGSTLIAAGCSTVDSEGVGMAEQLFRTGDYVTLASFNFPGLYVRHQNFLGELTAVSSQLDRADATFKLDPGLASAGCISFESGNFPGYYLRHQNLRIKLQPFENTDLYRQDATFCIKPPLHPDATVPWMSFESFNYPSFYIRHRNYHLYLERQGGPFQADATFKFVQPM